MLLVDVPDINDIDMGSIPILSAKSSFSENNIRYFDVDVPDNQTGDKIPFTVAVSYNPRDQLSVLTSSDYINAIKNHFTFVEERTREDLTGMEVIISYFQFVNMVSNLIHHTDREDVAARIAEKIAMEFEDDDISLNDIKAQFGFN